MLISKGYKISLDSEHIYSVEFPDGKIIHPIGFTKLCNDYGLIPNYYGSEWFGQRGVAVHRGTELIDKDDLDWDSVQDGIKPFLEAYHKFKEETKMAFQCIEIPLYHPQWNFCGTPDRFLPLLDLKTGQGYPIQLATYGELLRANDINPGTEAFMLTLKENGNYSLQGYKYYKLRDELEDFKSACRLNLRKGGIL